MSIRKILIINTIVSFMAYIMSVVMLSLSLSNMINNGLSMAPMTVFLISIVVVAEMFYTMVVDLKNLLDFL